MSYSPNGVDPDSSHHALSEDAERVFGRVRLQWAMSVALRYGLALVLVSAALGLAQTFLYYGLPQPFTGFALTAIAATFWYGGTKPGIFAALIAWLVRDSFFEPEVDAESRILYGLVFLVFALVMTLVMRGRNGLEAKIAEQTSTLTKTAEDLRRELARHKGTEDELRAIIDNAPVFFWSDLPDGYCDFLNQRWLTHFNLSLQEAQGEGWATLLHPDDAAHHLENWQKSVSAGLPFETEARFRCPDGEYRWFLTRAAPLRDKTGRIVKWYGTNIDIENLKQTERRLRESEYKLRQIIETVPALLWSSGPDGELTDVNQRILEDYFGVRFEDLLHRGWTDLLHPDDLSETANAFQHAIQTGTSYQAKHRLRRAGGDYRWHHSRSEPLRDREGRVIQWYGLTVDIDEAKKAEDRLRRSEAYLAEAQKLSHTGTWAFNMTETLYWSDEGYRIWGFDPQVGLPTRETIWLRVHPDDRDWVYEGAQEAIREKRDYFVGFRILLPDGTVKHIDSCTRHVFSEDGELVEVLGTHVDVTERTRAEEALRESEYKLRQIVETVPSLLWSTDPDGETTHLNQRILDYTGMRLEDLKQRGWQSCLHPDDLPETTKAFYHAIHTGTSYQATHRIRRADGEYRWHHARGEPLRDRQGHIIQWYGLTVDIDEAKKAEDRLRRSEAYLAEAQRLSHTGSWALSPDTRKITYWSEECYRIWGFDPAQGPPYRGIMWQRIHPDDQDRVYEETQEALRQKRDYTIEFRIVLPDGTVKYLEAVGHHRFSPCGELIQVVGTNVDLTERKRAENALRESEAKNRRLVDADIIGVFMWDVEGGIIEANDAFLRMVDYDRDDLASGRIRWTELTPPEWLDRDVTRWLPKLKATGSLQPFEKEYFRKDGSRVPVLMGVASFEEDANQGVAFVLDLTERKCAEQAARESEARFRDYAETASDWFWEIGPDYKFTMLTENAFGSDPAGRIGTACWEHALDLETEPEKWRLMQATLDSRKPFRDFTYCSKGPNGSPIYVRASGKPAFDVDGEFRGYRGTGSDVTAMIHAQRVEASLRADLAHVSRVTTLGQLTASIAHEITQPIAAARNNARAAVNFLDRRSPDLGEAREALECAVADADRAGDIIDRIRDQMKKAPPRSDYLELNKAINEVIALARSEILKNGISVQTRLAEGLPPVKGDRVQLQQVLMNLILNAIEAMSSVETGKRELVVSTEHNQAGDVLVAVRDSGPGIDPEHVDRLFEAFYTTKSGGVGIGLSICRSLIEAQGGRLWAEVNEPQGAVFQFTLAGAEKEIMNPVPAAHETAERHEDTVSAASHRPAYEGNKRPRRSKRARGQHH